MTGDLDKKYYRIADVAELTGVNKTTLRFWEREFSELRPTRNQSGTRYYTPADVAVVEAIRFLVKDKGLTLEGARDHLRRNRELVSHKQLVVRRLQAVRKQLTDILDALDSRQRDIRRERLAAKK
ncbi:MAG: MerR family transcriptional regulator [Muribaculaceae bacterium]|nr:MerR family transcriptional regulator [Muribaculaceae bacterium]